MIDAVNVFSQKVQDIERVFLAGQDFAAREAQIAPALCSGRFAVFAAVCGIHERAKVFRASADTLKSAWEACLEQAERYVAGGKCDPLWVKIDVVSKSERAQLSAVNERLENGLNYFFRKGIAFDEEFTRAITEAEGNCFEVYTYKKNRLELTTVNKFLAANSLPTLAGLPDEVTLFECESFFCDEKGTVTELYGGGNDCGRRKMAGVDRETAKRVISTTSDYLAMLEGLDGKFQYGFFPLHNKPIAGYNTVRHASSLWSLVSAYRITGDKFVLLQAKKAAEYLASIVFRKYAPSSSHENTAFLPDPTASEAKLGGNGIAIVALCELMSVTGEDNYREVAVELGNGILELFDERDGSFFHVLKYPSLAPRDKFRTVYYDGEAVFALCRLYGLTGEKRWIETAKMAVDRFIKEDYTQYRDHWVAYSVNELAKYVPEDKYLSFGLKNAAMALKKMRACKTTFHTYLELLSVTFELYLRITEQGLKCAYLEKFDAKQFVSTIFYRAWTMLNGYAFPEYAMYFDDPAGMAGGFFVRHHDYRVRIDDIGHFLAAYSSFYRNFDKLEGLRVQLGAEAK